MLDVPRILGRELVVVKEDDRIESSSLKRREQRKTLVSGELNFTLAVCLRKNHTGPITDGYVFIKR